MSGGTRSYEMARRLVSMGHEVHMVTTWREPMRSKSWFETKEDGIHVYWLPNYYSNTIGFFRRVWSFVRFSIMASFKTRTIKADIVFATSTPLTIAIPGVYSSRKQKIPMVFEVRDLWPEIPVAMGAIKNPVLKYIARKLEEFAYKNASAIVALSPGMRDGVIKTGYAKDRIAVIPNSCDTSLFNNQTEMSAQFRAKHDWLGERPLIVYTGTFGKLNGVDYMVGLAKELNYIAPDIRILLIGDGSEFDKVKSLAAREGVLDNNLFVAKRVSKKEIPSVICASTLSVSVVIDKKELWNNSANKIFDAFAAGKPLLINHAGWQKELLDEFGAGIVTWGLTHRDAAVLVKDAIQNKKWIESAGQSSKRLGASFFSRDAAAVQLEQIFRAVLEDNSQTVSMLAPGVYTKKT